jgi:serine/threonine protein phosphatase PrpC
MRPELDFAGRAVQGARDNQEDFHVFQELDSGGLLLVLADGVGGETGGERASHAAVYGFLDGFAEATGPDGLRFPAALRRANQDVARVIAGTPGSIHMATTLLAVRVENGELSWISVGDSPLLLFRRGEWRRLNADHSGKAEDHQPGLGRHALSSALTGGRIRLIDRPAPLRVEPGDLLLAATDGLWTLTLKEMAAHFTSHAAEGCASLVAGLLARLQEKRKPHQDNVTVAVIKIPAW